MSTTPNGPASWGQQPPPGQYGPAPQPWPGGSPAPAYGPQGYPTPTPTPPPPMPPVPGQVRPRSTGLRAAIITAGAVVAAFGLAGATTTAIARTHDFPVTSLADSVATNGISAIEIRSGMGDVTVVTGTGQSIEYELTARGARTAEDLVTRDGSTLVFDTRRDGDRWDWGFGWPGWDDDQRIIITVPARLVPDLTLDAGTGEVTIAGDFGDVELHAGVGDVTLSGTAASLRIDSGVGRVRADAATDGPVVVTGGVGEAIVDLGTTTAPESVTLDAGVGSVQLLLPPLTRGYDVRVDGGIGEVLRGEPQADPAGVDAGPVPVTIRGGVGEVVVGTSVASH